MAIFDFLRAPPSQQHPQLRSLQYSGGYWRGSVELESGRRIPLRLPGTGAGPSPDALTTAERTADWWRRVRPAVEKELFDHYFASRDDVSSDLPHITAPSDVWMRVTLSSVDVGPHRVLDEFQGALRTAWDDEHTLGALIRAGSLVELNGSILERR